ncbi:hypothetical protein EJB05_45973, partial [Eragrostis curvula]
MPPRGGYAASDTTPSLNGGRGSGDHPAADALLVVLNLATRILCEHVYRVDLAGDSDEAARGGGRRQAGAHFPRAGVDDDALGFDDAGVLVGDAHDLARAQLEKDQSRSRLEPRDRGLLELLAGDRDAVAGAGQVDAVHGVVAAGLGAVTALLLQDQAQRLLPLPAVAVEASLLRAAKRGFLLGFRLRRRARPERGALTRGRRRPGPPRGHGPHGPATPAQPTRPPSCHVYPKSFREPVSLKLAVDPPRLA